MDFENTPSEKTELNIAAIKQVIDVALLENMRNDSINSYPAIHGKYDNYSYLCWTISPTLSCVIKYSPTNTTEADIRKMAASLQCE